MVDWAPLAEGDPLPGDPAGIADLVGRLRGEGQRVRGVANRLRSLSAGEFWTGDSANAFASRVGRAGPDLDLAATRIETTATALNRYLQAMGDCQGRGLTAVTRAREAETGITRAQVELDAAHEQAVKDIAAAGAGALQNPGVPNPPVPGPAWGPNWNSVLQGAQDARADAARLFSTAVEDYEHAVQLCVRDLGPAVHDALTDPVHHGLFDRVVHASESVGHAIGHTLEDGYEVVNHMAETVADNIVDWAYHPFPSLDSISESLGLAAAVASFVPGGEGVALALSASKTALDYGLYKAGKKEWKDVRNDLIGTALFGAGRVMVGVSRARTAASAARDATTAAKTAGRVSAEIKEAEQAGEAVDSSLVTRLQTAQAEKREFNTIRQSLGQGTSETWWKESAHAFRHLDLKVPDDSTLSIDRFARYTARSSEVIHHYSETKEAAELVKNAGEAITGQKLEGPMIRGYGIP